MKKYSFALMLTLVLCGCSDSRTPEEAADLQKSDISIPEDGGEPVLSEEGP